MSGAPPPAADELEIRPYHPGDEAAIERGFERAFGVRRPAGEWAWKFPAAEREGGRRVMVAIAGGEVIAHMAAQPTRFVVDGRELIAGHVVDAFSVRRRGLARRGVFARTVDRFFATYGGADGLAFVIGFPGDRHMRLGESELGYVAPRPVPYREKALVTTPRRASPLRRTPAALFLRVAGLRVEEGFRAAAIDDLWGRVAGRCPVGVVRDGRRASERWTGRPGVEYVHLTAWWRRRAAAWAVARIDGDRLRWADLLWDGASPRVLAALEAALVRRALAAGARRGELWLGGDPAAEALLEARGWHRARHPQDLGMTAVSFLPDLDPTTIVDRSYVTLGDSDLV
ncbi:MAG TPA: GNAT family N-acetyltransferase [Thermoanaerobaculia bacterium]|nr:GNAT family N-acetyltransferase [Thermoanaerobaculia bacterium]